MLGLYAEGSEHMPRGPCSRHTGQHPCSCAMGNLSRFVEPVLLSLLRQKGKSYGYELAGELRRHALTDAEVEAAGLYRTLRQLEKNGCVTSAWEVEGSGPARRVYALTPRGTEHLGEWVTVLGHMSKAMARFVRNTGMDSKKPGSQQIRERRGSGESEPDLAGAGE